MKRNVHSTIVNGVDVRAETQCADWNSDLDIIAIRFKCCGEWFSCFDCHKAEATHDASVWASDERDVKAVLCGKCGHQLTIEQYFNCGAVCPQCNGRFNPGCANHYHLYFS